MDVLLYFEPLQKFEYRGDMFSFGVLVTARAKEFRSSWRRDIVFAVSLGRVSCNSLI